MNLKIRKDYAIVCSIVIVFSISIIIVSIQNSGSDKIIQQLIRFSLTLVLIVFTILNKNWAKWLLSTLLIIGGCIGLVFSLKYLSHVTTATVFLFLMSLYFLFAGSYILLTKNKSIKKNNKEYNYFNKIFIELIQNTTLEKFLVLRDLLLNNENFNPYSDELNDLIDLEKSEEYGKIIELIKNNLWPNHVLSPRTHYYLGYSYSKNGDDESAGIMFSIAQILTNCIFLTGDGSKSKPYLVLRVSDEYDVLSDKNMTFKNQSNISEGDRLYDVITDTNDNELWFDVTDIMKKIKKNKSII
ncbi:MAG: DUF4919 domain-containing protein [Spirochaetes bacterium]|nr:DUF4919 domain-containing protein [Spirochaetota bacterium]